MDQLEWIWAAIALGSGLLFGEIAGRLARRAAERAAGSGDRHVVLRESAGAIGSFVFWLSTAVGLLIAIAVVDTEVLDDLWTRLDEHLPRLGVAFLMVIAGYALSVALAAMVGQSARKATGVRQRGLERVLQAIVLATALVVALSQLGVESSILVVALAVAIGAPALAFALLSGLGGREVASELAAGRALRHQLLEGRTLECDGVRGTIVRLHPTTVEIECADGSRTHLPNRRMLTEPFSLSS